MLPRSGAEPSSDSRTSVTACTNGLMNSTRIDQIPSGRQKLLERVEHAVRLEWLQYEILRASLERLHDDRLLAHGCHHCHACVGVHLADFFEGGEAVHLGHGDVHEDGIRMMLGVLLARLEAVFGLDNFVPVLL